MTWLRDLFNIATATGFRPRVKQLKVELQNGVTRMISGAWMMLGFVAVVILKSSLFDTPHVPSHLAVVGQSTPNGWCGYLWEACKRLDSDTDLSFREN